MPPTETVACMAGGTEELTAGVGLASGPEGDKTSWAVCRGDPRCPLSARTVSWRPSPRGVSSWADRVGAWSDSVPVGKQVPPEPSLGTLLPGSGSGCQRSQGRKLPSLDGFRDVEGLPPPTFRSPGMSTVHTVYVRPAGLPRPRMWVTRVWG